MAHLPLRSTRRHLAVAFVAAGLAFTAASCGSDKKSEPVTTSPEDHIADDATVTAGLARMTATATKIATTVASGTKVSDAKDQLEVDWKEVEGRFKQNEPDLYLSVEEALGGIDIAAADGDTEQTARFAGDLGTAVASYLTKHP